MTPPEYTQVERVIYVCPLGVVYSVIEWVAAPAASQCEGDDVPSSE